MSTGAVRDTRPRFGARPHPQTGVQFRTWAPGRRRVELVLERASGPLVVPLAPEGEGIHGAHVPEAKPGDRYRYRLDEDGPWPDPASRFQPDGVHGASEVIDPTRFPWTDAGWTPPVRSDVMLYELHVGTFSPAGTFGGVADRLPHLRDLGVNAIELMPVADFPGRWNWGYDGVSLFAPARCYGTPDDLRALVDAAHRHGIAVFLDVVYNHLGPDGAYLAAFAPPVFSSVHHTPWGRAINLDGPGSRQVRDLFLDHAIAWLEEYHLDGLRLDATHAIIDESPTHFLAELAAWVRSSIERPVMLVAEDHRNLARLAAPPDEGGYGLDASWSDDLHHEVRRALTGDADGYFADFTGTPAEIATTLRQGWLYTGQYAEYFGEPRGTDPTGLGFDRFVVFTQNHDQIGNRAFGERLSHDVPDAECRALAALLLLAPEIPLLFMGQEWSATTPFQYFTDHGPELGQLVTEGRRREFARFAAYADPGGRARIPDPQDPATYERSRLRWDETVEPAHAAMLSLHRALIALRRSEPLLRDPERAGFHAGGAGPDALWMARASDGRAIVTLLQLRGKGRVSVPDVAGTITAGGAWKPVLSTEAPPYALDPLPMTPEPAPRPAWRFYRPGALILVSQAAAEAA